MLPDWYVPYEKRKATAKKELSRKRSGSIEKASLRAQEKAKSEAMDTLWNSLSAEQHEEYRKKALASFPDSIRPSMTITMIMAKLLAFQEAQSCSHK